MGFFMKSRREKEAVMSVEGPFRKVILEAIFHEIAECMHPCKFEQLETLESI